MDRMGSKVGRRDVLVRAGWAFGGAALAPLASLVGCGEGSVKGAAAPGATGAKDGAWATGGTKAMRGPYPDPFTTPPTGACKLTCSATIGPCYAETLVRKDLSEGHDGLPVRLALLVLDESCKPVPGCEIDLWHAAPEGVYSGRDASPMCTNNDAKALAARFFRGKQTTDAKGRVDFDTCFPGWYHGRTVHIHFTARVNGAESVTSQLFFDDALVDGIMASQVLYKERGARDTTNQNDGVITKEEVADYTFETSRADDGVMIARKAIILRSSSAAVCQTKGGNGPGGPGGGPPPGGFPGGPPPGGFPGGPPPGGFPGGPPPPGGPPRR